MVGLGSIINLAGGYYTFNRSATAAQADERALASDWAMVAEDIRGAMASVGGVNEEQMLLPLL